MSNFFLSSSDIVLYPESKYLALFAVTINPTPIKIMLKTVIAIIIGYKISANGLALGAVADFGAQNCQPSTNFDAR